MSNLSEIWTNCHDSPESFSEDVLDVRLRRWQRKLFREIGRRFRGGEDHVQVLARTCHGAGKTMAMACLVLWWQLTRNESRCLTTAPTWAGVENLLWPEITSLYLKSKLLQSLNFGKILNTKFEITEKWYSIGASSDRPENLEGHHSQVAAGRFVDEAKAVDAAIFESTLGMLDAPQTLDVWISTPSIESGPFWERDIRGGPEVIRAIVTIDDLVNENIPGKLAWRENARKTWGNSETYASRAMAQYIQNAEGALYPAEWVEKAMKDRELGPGLGRMVAGFDVAGSVDGDESVVALGVGPDYDGRYYLKIEDAWRDRDTMVSKGRALAIARREDVSEIMVDTIGLGKGVHDALNVDFPRTSAYRATDAAQDKERFTNKKAEDAWFLRELLEKGKIQIKKNPILRDQLVSMKYEIKNTGKTRIVDPKDSPDRVDALLIALSACQPSGRQINPGDFMCGSSDVSDYDIGLL